MQDLSLLNNSLQNLEVIDPTLSFGTSLTVYVSIPDSSATCDNLGLPSLPTGYIYNCVTITNLIKTDGTGWIPVNFTTQSVIQLSSLPIDPTNSASDGLYYTYIPGGSWKLAALIESNKFISAASNDGGGDPIRFEKGTDLSLVSNGPRLWLKADSLGISDNDPISTWNDMSGNNNNAVQSNVSYKPILKTNQVNGNSVVQFDGIDNYLIGGPTGISGTRGQTLFIVAKSLSWYGDPVAVVYLGSSTGADGQFKYFGFRTAPLSFWRSMGGAWIKFGEGFDQTSFKLIDQQDSTGGTNCSGGLYVNGAAYSYNAADGCAGTSNTDDDEYLIGASQGASNVEGFSNVQIAEIILYDHTLTTGERQSVEKYLNNKYALY
jgi:hypothetical protein